MTKNAERAQDVRECIDKRTFIREEVVMKKIGWTPQCDPGKIKKVKVAGRA